MKYVYRRVLLYIILIGMIAIIPGFQSDGVKAAVEDANTKHQTTQIEFSGTGYTEFGVWQTVVTAGSMTWRPGQNVKITADLRVLESHLIALQREKVNADGFCLLVTAERTFDTNGWQRLSSDERMSTLITPTGLAIEGGVQGAVTNRFGYGFRTPLDELVLIPMNKTKVLDTKREVVFTVNTKLPEDLPPGIYRLRFDYGVTVKKRFYDLNCEPFAKRPFPKDKSTQSFIYSPIIRASGIQVSGRSLDAAKIQPRMPWVLLANYNSNGYSGVVADEDKDHFALSSRNIIPDDVILPLYDDKNNKIAYSLEPGLPMYTIDESSNIPLDYTKGELAIQVTGPNGKTKDLGKAPFVARVGQIVTTKLPAFTRWKPEGYGQYTVKATGWVADSWGNRYVGGGTYHFWIAKRMTLATATFQGMSYPVGTRYGRDIGIAPAVPADVTVDTMLYVNSDPNQVRKVSYHGKASPGGIFGAAQGMQPLVLDAPGEYFAHILATYTDKDGHLWVCSMRHAGVVYPEDSSIVARGKKLLVDGKYLDRGETHFEGYVDADQTHHLAHLNYPFQSGDVLLIASDGEGANKIEPVLNYESKQNPAPYDPKIQPIGASNIRLQTSNGYSPHLFPEYITEWNYFYGSAARPGFMSRFIVGEDGTRAPYWPTTNSNFGGQINASNNGDLPGVIYRLIGGVVVRKKNTAPLYAGYLASGFIMPKGSADNRVIAPGAEDLPGPANLKARFFLVGTRPGMLYEVGTGFTPAVQVDPILPAHIKFVLNYPDGRQTVAEGIADSFGSFAGKDRWILDVPGRYHFTLTADWDGHQGVMPGLPAEGGDIYVIEKEPPAGAVGIQLDLPEQSLFDPAQGLTITGRSTAQVIYFAAVIPGSVIDQGVLTVKDGKFSYRFDPVAMNQKTPTYDIINFKTGKPEIKDVVHLTFFAKEVTAQGVTYHSFIRVIFRGNKVLYTK